MPVWLARTVCGFVLLGYGMVAQAVNVVGVRMWPAPDNTRLVFDLTAPVEHNLFVLEHPERIVIDLKSTDLKAAFPALTDASFIKQIRYARRDGDDLRVVLDLKREVKAKSFVLRPQGEYGNRLVVDLIDEAQDKKAAQPVREDRDQSDSPRKVLIAIDAGHGGDDPGAIGKYGTREKDVTLAIAHKLKALIDRQPGMQAMMTRSGDYFVSLGKRVEKAREAQADLFISIHADSFRNRSASGSSVYVLSEHGASSEVARFLAESENNSDLIGGVSLDDKDDLLKKVLVDMVKNSTMDDSHDLARDMLGGLRNVTHLHRARVEQAGFRVLKSPDIPSVLVETAFISNPKEERKLRDPGVQGRLAQAIFNGLNKYFRDNPPPGTLLAVRDRKHRVIKGDTLSALADEYQVPLSALRQANQIKGDVLQVGDVLLIPPVVSSDS
ncbi:MAG: AMIN domain-containing protein [Gammaproteobacteria bacterium]|nr:AMIN domain-containing protein [Gammaproteobacteria bacterium]